MAMSDDDGEGEGRVWKRRLGQPCAEKVAKSRLGQQIPVTAGGTSHLRVREQGENAHSQSLCTGAVLHRIRLHA